LAVIAAIAAAPTAPAATVTLRSDFADREPIQYEILELTDAAGEANDVVIGWTADAFVVEDRAARLTAERGCVQERPDRVSCPIPPKPAHQRIRVVSAAVQTGGGDDRLGIGATSGVPVSVSLTGGPGDDRVAGTSTPREGAPGDFTETGTVLGGGPGRDTLLGGPDGEGLTGDEGEDVLRGGGGDDTLNGESGAGGLAASSDLIDGGPGRDEVSYQGTAEVVSVDLADSGRDGPPGAGDELISVEDVTGGSRENVLRGDAGPNRLLAANGTGARVVLDGRDGDDELRADTLTGQLIGGAGDDRLIGAFDTYFTVPGAPYQCGPGVDVVEQAAAQILRELSSDCERVDITKVLVLDTAATRLTARAAYLGLTPHGPTAGVLELRDLRGRVLARRALRARGSGFRRIAVPLTRAGRRATRGGRWIDVRVRLRVAGSSRSGGFTLRLSGRGPERRSPRGAGAS
jgi:Ca2+-binding RTX toxin-like protein